MSSEDLISSERTVASSLASGSVRRRQSILEEEEEQQRSQRDQQANPSPIKHHHHHHKLRRKLGKPLGIFHKGRSKSENDRHALKGEDMHPATALGTGGANAITNGAYEENDDSESSIQDFVISIDDNHNRPALHYDSEEEQENESFAFDMDLVDETQLHQMRVLRRNSKMIPSIKSAISSDDGDKSKNAPPKRGVSFSEETVESSAPLNAVTHIEKLAQKSGTNSADERFRVVPAYAYPNTRFNRDELRTEMNKPSTYFHDLQSQYLSRLYSDDASADSQDLLDSSKEPIGKVFIEILQCFGLPRSELLKEISAFCLVVGGAHAFKTDVAPPVANPMWLCRMRRACVVPIFQAYESVSIGVFSKTNSPEARDGFVGRISVDVSRLRPGSTYDITLPLREHINVFTRRQKGAIRVRVHLEWTRGEKAALLSYREGWKRSGPDEATTIHCCDAKTFQNVARVVHGTDIQGKFSMKVVQATTREMNWFRVNLQRYIIKKQIRDTREWRTPLISAFVFMAWMHAVITASIRYLPGHFITFFLLHLWKNYAMYVVDARASNGFLMPTWEEMFCGLIWGDGSSKTRYIQPLSMDRADPSQVKSAAQLTIEDDNDKDPRSNETSLEAIADEFRAGIKLTKHSYFFRKYRNSFVGRDAVDFLVQSGHAVTREDAVKLGRRLESELEVFEHVSRDHQFEDGRYFYTLIKQDKSEYTIKTHEPWGRHLFPLINFANDTDQSNDDLHMELPLSTGIDHPRFTVKDSLVIRSRESKNMIKQIQVNEEAEAERMLQSSEDLPDEKDGTMRRRSSFGLGDLNGDVLNVIDVDEEASKKGGMTMLESISANVSSGRPKETTGLKKVLLKKPPNQDVDSKGAGNKKLPETLEETKVKMHALFRHMFHFNVYRLDAPRRKSQKRLSFRSSILPGGSKLPSLATSLATSHLKRKATKMPSFRKQKASAQLSAVDANDPNYVKLKKDEYDRLLHLGKYSTSNPIFAKVGVVVQPMIEILQSGLRFSRAVVNLFTWQDPLLSFWVSLIGPAVVIVLHLCPWRILFGGLGLFLVGPQNWAIRVMRENQDGYEPPDIDVVYKKIKKTEKNGIVSGGRHYFSMVTPNNDPITSEQLRTEDTIRQIVVPNTPLKHKRFYDWPPEPEYARVYVNDSHQIAMAAGAESVALGGDETIDSNDATIDSNQSSASSSPKAKKKHRVRPHNPFKKVLNSRKKEASKVE